MKKASTNTQKTGEEESVNCNMQLVGGVHNQKKKKFCRVFVVVLISFILILTAGFVFIFHAPYSFANDGLSSQNYKNVVSSIENIAAVNPKINQIAMLGSHDCFSVDITTESKSDPAEEGKLLANSFVKSLLGEMQVRYSVTQTVGALYQLNAGTRYFDVRLSYVDGEWWTKHGVLSGKFEAYLTEILQFLNENEGEAVIIDFQHIYTGDVSVSEFFDYLGTVEVGNKTIYDYIPYTTTSDDNSNIEFSELSYNDVTQSGANCGVVLFVDYSELEEDMESQTSIFADKVYNRYQNVRSLWHNSNDGDFILDGINAECNLLKTASTYDDCLRINQTQHAFQLKFGSILRNVSGWSLLNLAENHNNRLIEDENFDEWLSAMPILMVDFVTSTKGDFNAIVNQKIAQYNANLCNGGIG